MVNEQTPSVPEIVDAFSPVKEDLHHLSCEYELPILFTEYGFRSIDYGLWEAWNLGDVSRDHVNFQTQENGYRAFYQTFWKEIWVAGGFFWEWKILLTDDTNNPSENGWYVNDKPAEGVIRNWYE